MPTKSLTPPSKMYLKTTALCFATMCFATMVFASSQFATAQSPNVHPPHMGGITYTLHNQLCYLVQQAEDPDTRDYASENLGRISRCSPQDPNLAYLHALVLVNKSRYKDAIEPAQFAVRNNSRNPDAWKLSIWLTVQYEKDYDEGMQTMGDLAAMLNSEQNHLLCSTNEAIELSDFMGRVCGFLAGPAEMNELDLQHSEQQLTSYLTPQQNTYFTNAKTEVLENFSGRLYEISDERMNAQDIEEVARGMKSRNASEERDYLRGQMEQVEQHRMEARHGSSNERNVLAATRGSGYVSNRNYGGYYRHAGYSGHSYERGLDNRHYANINFRESQYNEHLSDREKNLRRRMNNLAKRNERMLKKPNNGNSRKVISGSKTATVLHTYVPLPVRPIKELETLLASYK